MISQSLSETKICLRDPLHEESMTIDTTQKTWRHIGGSDICVKNGLDEGVMHARTDFEITVSKKGMRRGRGRRGLNRRIIFCASRVLEKLRIRYENM